MKLPIWNSVQLLRATLLRKGYPMTVTERVPKIIAALKELYPDPMCALSYEKPHELLFAVRLSAQCTDARVNLITPALFARYPTLEDFATADVTEVEEYIRSCGFYRTKARDIVACAAMLINNYGGVLPDTIEELIKLPGVGRKTANLIVGDVYHKPAVVADTHCIRIAGRLGLTASKNPERVERDLRALLPEEESTNFCHRMVLHGRALCAARKPDCANCPLMGELCQYM